MKDEERGPWAQLCLSAVPRRSEIWFATEACDSVTSSVEDGARRSATVIHNRHSWTAKHRHPLQLSSPLRSFEEIRAGAYLLYRISILHAASPMMRSLLSLWLPALAAASTGQLFFYDSAKSSLQHGSIDSKTAGLVLASRVGVADFHDLGVVSDESLAVINEFGSQKRMFSHSPTRPVALLISTSPDSIGQWAEKRNGWQVADT